MFPLKPHVNPLLFPSCSSSLIVPMQCTNLHLQLASMKNLKQVITHDDQGKDFLAQEISLSLLGTHVIAVEGDAASEQCVYKPGETFMTADPHEPVASRRSEKGINSLPEYTIPELFNRAVARNGDKLAFVSATDETTTWRQYQTNVKVIAKALLALGLRSGESVNVLGFNSPEWLTMNMAAIYAGGKAAGIYTSNGPGNLSFGL